MALLGYYGSKGGNEVPGSCTQTHRQMTLASDLASSMSFFAQPWRKSAGAAPAPPLKQIPVIKLRYDSSKAYVAFVTSDGDNLAYDAGATQQMMAARVGLCAVKNNNCPPVSWTLSPRLPDLLRTQAEWYYEQAQATQRDSFLFGPSGYGYLYPAQLNPADQASFAQLTVQAAKVMDVSALVESENCCWKNDSYLQQRKAMYTLYGAGAQIKGVFTGNIASGVVGGVALISDAIPGYNPYAAVPLNSSSLIAQLNALPAGFVSQAVVIVTAAQAQRLAEVSRGVDKERVVLVGHRELMALMDQKQKLALKSDDVFVEAATLPTKGAAGYTAWSMGGKDYLAVANFFTSAGPGTKADIKTQSALYTMSLDGDSSASAPKLKLLPLQTFETAGAHGVEHFSSRVRNASGQLERQHYLAIPNYYGGDAAIYRWDKPSQRFSELQRIKCDGGGSVEAFRIGEDQMIGFAEFNKSVAAIYRLQGDFPNERFAPWQRIEAPGVGAFSTITVHGELLLVASTYVFSPASGATSWSTKSPTFAIDSTKSRFDLIDQVATVGAHDVEVLTIMIPAAHPYLLAHEP